MKNNLIRISIGIFSVALIMAACKKDNDELKNRVTYDGQSYDLTKGYICDLTTTIKAAGYKHTIFLASKDIVIPAFAPPIGTGNWVGLWLNSPSDSEIVPGTYTFAYFSSEEYTFYGQVMLESSYVLKSFPNTDIASGTLDIDVNDDIYTVNFKGTIVGGESVTAYYKGHVITLIND